MYDFSAANNITNSLIHADQLHIAVVVEMALAFPSKQACMYAVFFGRQVLAISIHLSGQSL